MLTVEAPIIDGRNTDSDSLTLNRPVQYALHGASVVDACVGFSNKLSELHFSAIGQYATDTLTELAKGLLVNGIAVEEIESFSSMSLVDRGKSHASIAEIIQISFNDYIWEHAESVCKLSHFTLGIDTSVRTACVSLTPDFVFAYATMQAELKSHPLYFGMQQLIYQLARNLTVADDIDLLDMKESQLEDYVTIKNKTFVIEKLEEIETDAAKLFESDEQSEAIKALNKKYKDIIEFYEDWFDPSLIDDLRFVLCTEKSVRLSIDELHHWVSQEIVNQSLHSCSIAIALLDDVNALRHNEYELTSFSSEGDDPIMNKLILLSETTDAISDMTWHEIESQGNDAWNNGTDTYFKVDLENPTWCHDLNAVSQLWEMVTRYMCVEY